MTHRSLVSLNCSLSCVSLICLSDQVEMAIKNMEYSALNDAQVAAEPHLIVCSVCCWFA